jgi:uncharacterized protein (DUF488 family)
VKHSVFKGDRDGLPDKPGIQERSVQGKRLQKLTVYTIGHSTHTLDEFLGILRANGIEYLVDVRTIPKSRHNPQFNSEALAVGLREAGIGYEHMPGLGGLRHAKKDSVNTGWENASFRGFADYMQTGEFESSLQQLMERAREGTSAIMCAEAVPWRCHRSLIGDALLVRGITVLDIMSRTSVKEHSLTPWARTNGDNITYPGPQLEAKPQRKRKQGS